MSAIQQSTTAASVHELPELPAELLVFYAHLISRHDLRLFYSRRQIQRCVRQLRGYGVDLRRWREVGGQ